LHKITARCAQDAKAAKSVVLFNRRERRRLKSQLA
jgi:hypothetical protein